MSTTSQLIEGFFVNKEWRVQAPTLVRFETRDQLVVLLERLTRLLQRHLPIEQTRETKGAFNAELVDEIRLLVRTGELVEVGDLLWKYEPVPGSEE